MANYEIGRRQFLLTAAGAAVLPRFVSAHTGAAGLPGFAPSYDRGAKFEIGVSDVDFRKNAAGRMLQARVYRPNGPGPFPTLLDLHGGVRWLEWKAPSWNGDASRLGIYGSSDRRSAIRSRASRTPRR